MKMVVYKSVSFIMALVVLCSTMSFTIDKHYCGSMLVDVAINKKAQKCGMHSAITAAVVDNCAGAKLTKKSCCKDEQLLIKGQDELKKGLDGTLEFEATAMALTQTNLEHSRYRVQALFIALGNHDPPDIPRDFQKMYETYLI